MRGIVTLLLVQFGCLQLLDAATTMLFPWAGLQEANPLIGGLADWTGSPLGGLLAAKGAGMAVAIYCWRVNYARVLRRANVFYTGVVVWNLLAILIKSAAAG